MSFVRGTVCQVCRKPNVYEEGATRCQPCIESAQRAIRGAVPSPSHSSPSLTNRVFLSPPLKFRMQTSFMADLSRQDAEKLLQNSSNNCLLRNALEYDDCPFMVNGQEFHHLRSFVFSYKTEKGFVYHLPLVLSATENQDTFHLSIAQHASNFPPYAQGVLQNLPGLTLRFPREYNDALRISMYQQQATGEALFQIFEKTAMALVTKAQQAELYSDVSHPLLPVSCKKIQVPQSFYTDPSEPLQWHKQALQLRSFSRSTAEKHLKNSPPFHVLFYRDEETRGQRDSIRLYSSYKAIDRSQNRNPTEKCIHIPLTLVKQPNAANWLLIPGHSQADQSWTFLTDQRGYLLPPLYLSDLEEANLSNLIPLAGPYLEKVLKAVVGVGLQNDYQAQWHQGRQQLLEFPANIQAAQTAAHQCLLNAPPKTFLFYRVEEIEKKSLNNESSERRRSTVFNFGFSYTDVRGTIHHGCLSVDAYKGNCFMSQPAGFFQTLASPSFETPFEKARCPSSADFYSLSQFLIQEGIVQKFAEKAIEESVRPLYKYVNFTKERPVYETTLPPKDVSYSLPKPAQLIVYEPSPEELSSLSAEPSIETPIPRNLVAPYKQFLNESESNLDSLKNYLQEDNQYLLGSPGKYEHCDLLIPQEHRELLEQRTLFTLYYRKNRVIYGVPLILGKGHLFLAKYAAPSPQHPQGTLKIPLPLPARATHAKTLDSRKDAGDYLFKAEDGRVLALLRSAIQNQLTEVLCHLPLQEKGEGFSFPTPRCLISTKEKIEDTLHDFPPHTVFVWKEAQSPLLRLIYKRPDGERVSICLQNDAQSTKLNELTVGEKYIYGCSFSWPSLSNIVPESNFSLDQSLAIDRILFTLTHMKFKGSALPDADFSEAEYERVPVHFPSLPTPTPSPNPSTGSGFGVFPAGPAPLLDEPNPNPNTVFGFQPFPDLPVPLLDRNPFWSSKPGFQRPPAPEWGEEKSFGVVPAQAVPVIDHSTFKLENAPRLFRYEYNQRTVLDKKSSAALEMLQHAPIGSFIFSNTLQSPPNGKKIGCNYYRLNFKDKNNITKTVFLEINRNDLTIHFYDCYWKPVDGVAPYLIPAPNELREATFIERSTYLTNFLEQGFFTTATSQGLAIEYIINNFWN